MAGQGFISLIMPYKNSFKETIESESLSHCNAIAQPNKKHFARKKKGFPFISYFYYCLRVSVKSEGRK
jgi:hypothetical protein